MPSLLPAQLQAVRQRLRSSWLFTANCQLCQRPVKHPSPAALCQRCDTQLQSCSRPHQAQLNYHIHRAAPRDVPTCSAERRLQLLAWGNYEGNLRQFLRQLKYHNQPQIAQYLGQQLAQAWQQHDLPQLALIPIPMHREKQQQRGYNQAELIARSCSQFTGMRCYTQILHRHKTTQPQHGLSVHDRKRNLSNAFSLGQTASLKQPIVLVDDIYTTGATLRAATECLIDHGYQVWGGLVVAR